MDVPLDKVVDKVVAFGVPGLVLVVAISISGEVGEAAIVVALASLGGPLGMLGGLALLAVILFISRALAQYGLEAILTAVVEGLKKKGMKADEIRSTVQGYWLISQALKKKLLENVK